jgi:ribonuclease BN (tRNA processing enzyme)
LFEALNNIIVATEKLNQTRFVNILTDIQNYHMNPASAARIAKEANVKKLVLVHITPSLPGVEKVYLNAMHEIFDGEIAISEDHMKFTLVPK